MKSHLPVGRAAGPARLRLGGDAARCAVREARPAVGGSRAHHRGPGGAEDAAEGTGAALSAFSGALDRQAKKFIVALADTNNIVAVDQLRAHLKGDLEIELRLAGDSEIERAIEHYYGHEFSIDGILREIETGEVDYTSISEGDEYSQPVVRLISALLADAVERSASDIHFEPEQNFLRIRYRIDGVLRRSAACTRPTGRRWRCA
jgi:type II secretory ATPase GspE/PulE/Tfp pilus assembly ATPase PilB-like protein